MKVVGDMNWQIKMVGLQLGMAVMVNTEGGGKRNKEHCRLMKHQVILLFYIYLKSYTMCGVGRGSVCMCIL